MIPSNNSTHILFVHTFKQESAFRNQHVYTFLSAYFVWSSSICALLSCSFLFRLYFAVNNSAFHKLCSSFQMQAGDTGCWVGEIGNAYSDDFFFLSHTDLLGSIIQVCPLVLTLHLDSNQVARWAKHCRFRRLESKHIGTWATQEIAKQTDCSWFTTGIPRSSISTRYSRCCQAVLTTGFTSA